VSSPPPRHPPFVICQDRYRGRRQPGGHAGRLQPQINAVRQAFKIIFREGLVLPGALARMEQELGHVDVIQEMLAFLKHCPRGINPVRRRDEAA
jgi:hypothetical protein